MDIREVVAELVAAIELGLRLKRWLLWPLVQPDDVPETAETVTEVDGRAATRPCPA